MSTDCHESGDSRSKEASSLLSISLSKSSNIGSPLKKGHTSLHATAARMGYFGNWYPPVFCSRSKFASTKSITSCGLVFLLKTILGPC